ncbi:MAG TPA: alpha/beta fold hydrolase [Chloroflexota bacterium]|nr:alpha/beta fold hydrolase [Chloroflexota bacterium]
MTKAAIQRYVRPLSEVRTIMLERAREQRNPFDYTEPGEVARIFDGLTSLDREEWAAAFSRAAAPHVEEAAKAEAAGDVDRARAAHLRAYGYYRVARYPAPNSPAKREAYRRSQEHYLAAGRLLDPPIERVEMPFHGRAEEGSHVVGLLRRPRADARLPVLINFGGIDSFKEERRADPFLAAGLAVLAVDMPGVADAPVAGSEDAERMFDAVFDWIATRRDLDDGRVGVIGGSTGGYWAAKLAHTHKERLCAVVNQGGCAHFAFLPDWVEKSQHGEYPFELAETLACAFGLSTFDDWVENAPRFSLLTQAVLDRPCAPLLCVNGIHDSVFPIADHYLLLQHGDPKSARFFDVGHMGHTPQTTPIIVNWLSARLRG